jgi:hypothetical protein
MEGRHHMPPRIEAEAASGRIQLVAPAGWIARVDDWRRRQPTIPSRSEAIRHLVDLALGDATNPAKK